MRIKNALNKYGADNEGTNDDGSDDGVKVVMVHYDGQGKVIEVYKLNGELSAPKSSSKSKKHFG